MTTSGLGWPFDDKDPGGSSGDLWRLPDHALLTRGLATILCSDESQSEKLAILDRVPNPYASQVPSEVVTCQIANGRTMQVLCKYGHPPGAAESRGHWGGVAYETCLYRTLLAPLGVGAPHFYGSYEEANAGRTWLVLEYLDRTLRVSHCPETEAAMISAARWLGNFHARTERWLVSTTPSFKRYDAAYYRGWTGRTLTFARRSGHASAWLRVLCERPDRFIRPLLEASPTVIHGEFYPQNVLSREGQIVPIDWETAAVAAGEIDLASLSEGWEPQIASRCEEEYQRSRWSSKPSPHFDRALAAARVYWQVRWLGDRPGQQNQEVSQRRFAALRTAAERLGII